MSQYQESNQDHAYVDLNFDTKFKSPRKTLTFEIVEQRLLQLETRANIPKTNYQGKSKEELNSELLKAAQTGETQSLINLLEAGADADTRDESHDTSLHLSAARGHDAIVEALVDHGLDVDARGGEARTPLMAAAVFSRGSTVKLLLDKGARLDLKNKADETAFQMILDKQMLITREYIIDRMISEIPGNCYDEALEEYKITRKIKAMLPSSVGLRDSIKSVQERFKWGLGMFWFMLVKSFFLEVIIGTGFYFLDIYTDVQFTLYLFDQSERNFTAAIEKCTPEFHSQFNFTQRLCEAGDNFDSDECLRLVRIVKIVAEECFVHDKRFENSFDWKIVGIISAFHCTLPIIVSIMTWMFSNNWKLCNRRSLLTFPLPFVTKIYQFHYTKKLFTVYTKDRRGEDDKSYFELSRGKWMNKIRNHEAVVNLSLLIEAAIESSFQFWFQTTFLIPTVIITITDGLLNWTDLFSWRLASICISFGAFAYAFYNIR